MNSSWIKDINFNDNKVSMTLKNGDIYLILNIAKEAFNDWKNSMSKGAYYNSNIRDSYQVRQIS